MTLDEFVRWFIDALRVRQIPYCVLRNYEGLPEANSGRDIDVLVRPADLRSVVAVLHQNRGITVVGLIRRQAVLSVFLHGIEGSGRSALEIDLVSFLGWKGFEYLAIQSVLNNTRLHRSSDVSIQVPGESDEAIITYMSTYLAGGRINHKYDSRIRLLLSQHARTSTLTLTPYVGEAMSRQVVGAMASGDGREALRLRRPLLLSLVAHNFLRRRLRTFGDAFGYMVAEIWIRANDAFSADIILVGRNIGSEVTGRLAGCLQGVGSVVEAADDPPGRTRFRRLNTVTIRRADTPPGNRRRLRGAVVVAVRIASPFDTIDHRLVKAIVDELAGRTRRREHRLLSSLG